MPSLVARANVPLVLALLLTGCEAADTDTIAELVCTYGQDWTCNDNPAISSIHGQCEDDGTCTCFEEFGGKNLETGRCY